MLQKQIQNLKNDMEKKPKLTKKERRALAEATSSSSKNEKTQVKEKKLTKQEKRALRVNICACIAMCLFLN